MIVRVQVQVFGVLRRRVIKSRHTEAERVGGRELKWFFLRQTLDGLISRLSGVPSPFGLRVEHEDVMRTS